MNPAQRGSQKLLWAENIGVKFYPYPEALLSNPPKTLSLSLITTSSSDILNITIYSLPHFKKKKKKNAVVAISC